MTSSSILATGQAAAAARKSEAPKPARLASLDVFRGMTIAGMILVNNPGTWSAIYNPLRHARWHGWTPTDLIFPFFLFIVGVSMMLSFGKRKEQGAKRGKLMLHVLRRSATIFTIGLFLAAYPYFNLSSLRIPGVLQRIALCYLFASVIALFLGRLGRIASLLSLLVGYWVLMRFVPVPGYGVAQWTPDGNLGAYLDRTLLSGHLYQPTWDPEGLLSTLPATGTVLFGTLVADWLKANVSGTRKALGLIAGGVVVLLVGRALDPIFPLNKNLWTSSFAIFTAGFASLTLGVCYWLVDLKGWRAWAKPFVIFGVNPILAYALSGLMAKSLVTWGTTDAGGQTATWKAVLYNSYFAPLASPMNASLLWAVSYVLLWLGVMWIFYRKQIFVKV